MKKNKKGLAIVVVMAFAFGIAIIMFAMVQSSSNLTAQTKRTIYQMQASYLAQSCIQFAKLHIFLLPKEMYNYYKDDRSKTDSLENCQASLLPGIGMKNDNDISNDYDLFENDRAPVGKFPFKGDFHVEELKYLLSNDNMKMVQDNYHIKVFADVDLGKGKTFKTDPVEEDFIVSRFSGR